jgi:hypothetical protein
MTNETIDRRVTDADEIVVLRESAGAATFRGRAVEVLGDNPTHPELVSVRFTDTGTQTWAPRSRVRYPGT